MAAAGPSTVPAHRWRSPLLGEPRTLDAPARPLECFDRGEGPAIVFAHGWLANANLWREVVEPPPGGSAASRSTCRSAPTATDGRGADLTPSGCGELIVAALAELDLAR